MIISQTPYRLPLSGGGTDINFYYKKKNGAFISLSINQYVYVLLASRKIDQNYLIQTTSTQFSNKINSINHDLIRETLKFFKLKDKMHVGTYSTVPTRTGLGTSSAMVVGLVNCINEYKKLKLNKKKIYSIAYEIERKICKVRGGWQDQIVSTYGGAIYVEISKKEKIIVKNLSQIENLKKIVNNHLILVYTNIKRDSSLIIKDQENQNRILELYDQLKKFNKDVIEIIKKPDIENLGKIFSHHWILKKKLSSKISDKKINLFYDKISKIKNFLGSKMIGAGGGGFFLVCVKNKKNYLKSLERKNISYLELNYEAEGSQIIKF